MQSIIGTLMLIFGGFLYIVQVISSLNFPLAQRLGIQEDPKATAPLLQRAERYTAYWDLLTLIWFPFAGLLMLLDHPLWTLMALAAGSIYLDAAGREAVKNLSFRHAGLATGTQQQQKGYFASYLVMAAFGVTAIFVALNTLIDIAG